MRLRFADCVFDSDTREVLRAGKPVHVSPKAFALLAVLIERRPKAVAKDELHKILWPETFVSDANLPNLVAELRELLGDDAQKPRILRTVQRFGYAFIGSAQEVRKTVSPVESLKFVYRLIWGTREVALGPGENLLGRDEDSIVWIDDPLVSRQHARIVIDGTGAVLEDLDSKNGTYVNGKRIEAPRRLADQDQMMIGPAALVFRIFKQATSTATAIVR